MHCATVRLDPGSAIPVEAVTLRDPGVEMVALHQHYNLHDGTSAQLVEFDGDPERIAAVLADDDAIVESEVTDSGLAYIHRGHSDRMEAIIDSLRRNRIVVDMPIESLGDGEVRVHLIGTEADLHEAVGEFSAVVSIELERLGPYDPTGIAGELTDRQRAVVRTAIAAGYYESPRRATQADVADACGIAPRTVGEHLRKAESALVRAAVG
jgi:hypothetical protein